MAIKYKPTVFRSAVNVKHRKPLRTVLRLFLASLILMICLYIPLGFFVEKTAHHVTPTQELWLWEHMRVNYDIVALPKKKKLKKMQRRLQRLFAAIPKDNLPIKYNYRVLLDHKPFVNAFAVPGGKIIVTTALLEMLPDDRALTFVLGHELGHFQGRHHLIALERLLVMTMLSKTLFGRDVSGLFAKMSGLFSLEYSRRQELEADMWGLKLLKETYGDYEGAKTFFEKMDSMYGSHKLEEFFSTHPSPDSRIKHIDKQIKTTSFRGK